MGVHGQKWRLNVPGCAFTALLLRLAYQFIPQVGCQIYHSCDSARFVAYFWVSTLKVRLVHNRGV